MTKAYLVIFDLNHIYKAYHNILLIRIISDTKESLTMFSHFSSAKSASVNGLLEADYS